MATRTTATSEAHAKAVTYEIADIARFLQENLGQKLTAYLAGVTDPKRVGHWAKGAQAPRADPDRRMRAAFQIFHVIQSVESPHVVRAWFIGMNPQLDDVAPAAAIRADQEREVLAAARAFVAGG